MTPFGKSHVLVAFTGIFSICVVDIQSLLQGRFITPKLSTILDGNKGTKYHECSYIGCIGDMHSV